ncbi:MAG: thrombospondin type 3 repeat-containing protein [Deltaproteobacteria bacterium]|nr:thrombospondin type 3 repeat-containing protein [Deltaproteobacteria bacterium]
MKKTSLWVFLSVFFAYTVVLAQDFALTATIEGATTAAIGEDGIDGNNTTTYALSFSPLLTVGSILIDFSAFGTGDGNGIDLSNVSTNLIGGDVDADAIGLLGAVLPTDIQKDNDDKTILITLASVTTLGSTISIEIEDIQNPPCTVSGNVVVTVENLLSSTLQGNTTLSFTGSDTDTDGDGLSDGFEIYYSNGASRGDTDGNLLKNGHLDPDVVNDPTLDIDGDGFGNRLEFLGCTNPTDSASKPAATDDDGDNIYDVEESFPGQELDTDGDTIADTEDEDSDNDGTSDADEAGDNLPQTLAIDTDGDGVPNFQDLDADNDGVADTDDNCILVKNSDQADTDANGIGDACQNDSDGDGIADNIDNCINIANRDQADLDDDGKGDVCDEDDDDDGIVDGSDNCPRVANADQTDTIGNGTGDACNFGAFFAGGQGCQSKSTGWLQILLYLLALIPTLLFYRIRIRYK